MRAEQEKWGKVLKEIQIKPEYGEAAPATSPRRSRSAASRLERTGATRLLA